MFVRRVFILPFYCLFGLKQQSAVLLPSQPLGVVYFCKALCERLQIVVQPRARHWVQKAKSERFGAGNCKGKGQTRGSLIKTEEHIGLGWGDGRGWLIDCFLSVPLWAHFCMASIKCGSQ